MTDKKNGRHDLGQCIVWYKDSLVHREDGPAIEWSHGTKEWHINNQLHREDGPAMEYSNGTKYWFKEGQLHRENGPTIEYSNGEKEWYLRDNKLTEEEFNQWLDKKNLHQKLEDNLLSKPMLKRAKI